MNQIERIEYMERLFDLIIEARKEQPAGSEKSARIQEALRILAEYYTSDEWKQDFADDEAMLMVLHPGYVDEYVLNTSYITTQRALEVAMAINPETKKWCEENDVKLLTYADL